eukprot:gene21129-biopygen11645
MISDGGCQLGVVLDGAWSAGGERGASLGGVQAGAGREDWSLVPVDTICPVLRSKLVCKLGASVATSRCFLARFGLSSPVATPVII